MQGFEPIDFTDLNLQEEVRLVPAVNKKPTVLPYVLTGISLAALAVAVWYYEQLIKKKYERNKSLQQVR